MDVTDCIIAGGGVVGLAIARQLSRCGLETVIIERAEDIGTETSSRNSEVIHAGIYYPPGSLKAELCVEGRGLLYDFASSHNVPFRRCGKLIVATSAGQEKDLETIITRAARAGVTDLVPLSSAQVKAMEPEVACVSGLFSPSTGIVDSHQLMLALLGEAEAHGAMLCRNTAVTAVRVTADGFVVDTKERGGGGFSLGCRIFVNAAGLWASEVAGRIDGLPRAHVPETRYARGTYFSLPGRAAFSRLVYPVPEPGGLGVHLTLDMGGQMRFGPDVEWIDGIDYRLNPARRAHFETEIRKYWPGLPVNALAATYCGIRPKLSGPGEPAADFRIDGPAQHGIPGLVNLFGIESPGLTSSLALAERVERLLESHN